MTSVQQLVEQLLEEKKALPDALKNHTFKKGESDESKDDTDAEKEKKGHDAVGKKVVKPPVPPKK